MSHVSLFLINSEHMNNIDVCFLCLILVVPRVGLLSVIGAFPGHTHLFFNESNLAIFKCCIILLNSKESIFQIIE